MQENQTRENQMQENLTYQTIKEYLDGCSAVLVGIGTEWASTPEKSEALEAAYRKLSELLKGKNYFIVTTNTDDHIFDFDLDREKITAPFGSCHRYQCPTPCCGELWTESELPENGCCPNCGKKLIPNVREKGNSASYLENGYLPQWQTYTAWLTHTLNQNLVILELGVDFDAPSVIRWPFERIAFLNQKAHFFRLNQTWHQLSEELAETGRAFRLAEDSMRFFGAEIR